MKKISIIGQIAEVEREIAQRESLYPRMVREGRMKEAERVMLMDRIHAVRNTLLFCREHEADIRIFIQQKQNVQGGAR